MRVQASFIELDKSTGALTIKQDEPAQRMHIYVQATSGTSSKKWSDDSQYVLSLEITKEDSYVFNSTMFKQTEKELVKNIQPFFEEPPEDVRFELKTVGESVSYIFGKIIDPEGKDVRLNITSG